MPPIEAVTFDLGDTITDLREGTPYYAGRGLTRAGKVYDLLAGAGVALAGREAFCAGLAQAIEEGYAAATARGYGLTLDEALSAYLAQVASPLAAGLLERSSEAWCLGTPPGRSLRLGARDTLAALQTRGLRLGVISNTIQPGRFLDAGLARDDLLRYFSATVYSSETGAAKPNPAIFQAALAALHVAPGRAVHVGDRLVNDVAGAQAVGMRAILIEVPQRVEDDPRITPDARIRELPELLDALDALAAGGTR